MKLMTISCQANRDADRTKSAFWDLIPDLPRGRKEVLRTCLSVKLKYISMGVYYHPGLKANLIRYTELWLGTFNYDTLNLYINVDSLTFSIDPNQQLWLILGREFAPRFSVVHDWCLWRE